MSQHRLSPKRAFLLAALFVVVAALAVPSAATLRAPSPAPGLAVVTPAASNVLSPYTIGMAASLVLGQSSFTTSSTQVSPTNISDPEAVAMDTSGDLWVADGSDSRVLEFAAPLHTGEVASLVLGQPNFYSSTPALTATGMADPTAVAFDPHGDLWVSDWSYIRVEEFVPPFHTGMAASVVIGQTSFTTSTTGTSATKLSSSNRIAFDPAGDLFVADSHSSRVLEFAPPFTNGSAAVAVLGQQTFTQSKTGLTATNLSFPIGVAATASMLWVGDAGNLRVVGFPLPATSGEAAKVVLGQANFTVSGGAGGNITSDPVSMTTNAAGDLFVSDYVLNRVVEFMPPFTPFKAPSVVLGQSSVLGRDGGLSATNLSDPTGLAIGPDGTLWVGDPGNSRVLGYVPSTYGAAFEESGLPTGTPWSATLGTQTGYGSTATIDVPAINGTYDWTIGAVPPGYHVSAASSGTVVVNGSIAPVSVSFSQNSTGSSWGNLLVGLGVGVVVGVVVGVAVGTLVARRGKGTKPLTPAASGGSAPGGAGAPPSSPPANSPPPGASS